MPEHFFVVGAQRSGTTYLHRVLDEHPGIAMARPVWPEPKFFFDDEKYVAGVDWYEETFFAHAKPSQLRGEKSVGYLESEVAADRIAAAFPTARIVAILRNPVDRAISNYRFSVENGIETLPIDEAMTIDETHRAQRDGRWFVVNDLRIAANPFIYRRRGRYVEDLRGYTRRFGKDRVHVMVFEDVVGSSDGVARLYRFLGVDPDFAPPTLPSVVNAASNAPTAVADSLRRHLAEHFAPSNRALADEFELDLSSWEQPG